MPSAPKIESLQVLRGVAASMVVYAHSIDAIPKGVKSRAWQLHVPGLENIGCAGVDVFFVISGFVIAMMCAEGRYSGAKDFLFRRATRLYPPYILITLWLGFRRSYQGWPPDVFTWVRSLLLLPPFSAGDKPYIVFIAWTLGFEMWFYLLAAISLRFGQRASILYLSLLPTLLVMIGLIMRFESPLLVFMTNPIQLEFVFGVILGNLFVRGWRPRVPACLLLTFAGCAWFVATMVVGYGRIDDARYTMSGALSLSRVGLWGIAAALLIGGIVFLELASAWTPPAWASYIGDSSYVLYLISTSTIGVWARAWKRTGFSGPDLFILMCTIATVGVGCVFYSLFDKPAQRLIKRLFPTRSAVCSV